MDVLVLTPDLQIVGVLDTFESLIWVDRYNDSGDFEIYSKVSMEILSLLQKDYYLWRRTSERLMIIEDITIKFDVDDGNTVIFSGRSIESILNRRIVWSQTTIKGSLQLGVKTLLDENAISPMLPERTIPKLIFKVSTDPAITSLELEAQFIRTNLFESVRDICQAFDIGFKIVLSDDLSTLVFKLYAGEDRSYSQFLNPYIIFSPKFDNLISSTYKESQSSVKNVNVVAGEGDEETRKMVTVGTASGLNRREMYTDAGDISQTVDGVLIPDADYLAQLEQRGLEELLEYWFEPSFEGEIDPNVNPKYGEDFFLGDIVQLANEIGLSSTARISEFTYSQSPTGINTYPTFVIIEE